MNLEQEILQIKNMVERITFVIVENKINNKDKQQWLVHTKAIKGFPKEKEVKTTSQCGSELN